MDDRRRRIEGAVTTVGELAAAEPLLDIPVRPFPAELKVERTVSPRSLVAFDGNFYSLPPGLPGVTVKALHRLGEDDLRIAAAGRAVVACHRRAQRGAGQTVRDDGHVIALERAVLSSFSDRAPCKTKVRKPPSAAALAEAERLREGPAAGSSAERVVIDLTHYDAVADRLRSAPSLVGGEPGVNTSLMQVSEARRFPAAQRPPVLPRTQRRSRGAERVLDEARTERMSLTAALERLLEIEVEATEACKLAARQWFACLPEPWTLADFHFAAQPGVDEKLIRDLATLRFPDYALNLLFVGPPGVGRTMLSVAHGRAAVDAGHRVYFTTAAELAAKCHKAALEGRWKTCMRSFASPKLLIIDELGYLPLSEDGASALFQVINQRYLKSSTILTTNVGIADWAGSFGDATVAAAMLDRLLHRAAVAGIDGPSYRLRGHQNQADALCKGVNARVS
ncbi:IS21-like element helper ATPase IstB [Streptomyces sennicomposti]|uniref:IS21-like element helper ATPase IstB n=1 Tax=Streptomyces sennicomposti TaxID=2873384 RepID=UPI001FFDCCBA|nr:IS21-like element helper ATPase IstB [Streptomyces sennicomposti]